MPLGALGGLSGARVCGAICLRGGSRQFAVSHKLDLNRLRVSWAVQQKRSLSRPQATRNKASQQQLPTDGNQMSQTLAKTAVASLLLAAAGLAFYIFGIQHVSLKDVAASLDKLVRSYGPYGPVIFVSAYIAATLVLIPSTALTLAAGYLFGPGFGTLLVSLAATLGASLAFVISRYLAQPYAKAKLQAYPKLESIEEQISAEGIKLVFLLRLAPLVPFTVLNYALGVTDVSFGSYVAATWLGFRPALSSNPHHLLTASRQSTMTTAAAISTIQAPADGDFYKYGLKPVLGQGIMDATLKRLGTVQVKAMDKSNFVKPQSVMYELDGKQRRWDMISSHSSVGVIIYHTGLDALIVVRQFRPPAYASAMKLAQEEGQPEPPLSVGFTYELCAGIIDKKKSLQEIAAEEVKEECGYEVPPDKMQWVTQYVSAVGTSGSRHDMYYAEVDESMRVGEGGGLEGTGERIEVLALPLDESKGFTEDPSYPKSAGLLFGLMWLRAYIAAKKQLPAGHVV